jgi:Xaa-Pro aminopeptidase
MLLARSLEHPSERDERLLDAIIELRLVHDAAAIAELRAATIPTAAGHRAAMAATSAGVPEHAIRAAFDGAFFAHGAAGHAYSPIVTVHGEVLHSHSHDNVLADGDLLLADVGAESAGGFACDVTRVWPVSGRFSSTQRELYELVLASQEAAIAASVPGARWRDVHLVAARVIAEGLVALGILRGDVGELVADGVHALFFPHGVGHLLGLDVHDMEDLGDHAGYAPGRTRSDQFGLSYLRLDRDLVPGMAVTVEPGFYQVPAILEDPRLSAVAGDRLDRDRLARFSDVRGIRIEDDVLVTAQGNEILTAAIPKAPADVEAAVGR